MGLDPAVQQPEEASLPSGNDEGLDEMQQELDRLGLSGDLVAVVMKSQVSDLVSFASPLILLPEDLLVKAMGGDKGLDAEAMTLGLRRTVDELRPHGPTILLAESLLSLTRSSRGYISLDDAMEQILEAIGILRTLHADRRLGRAFLDLGLILRDNRNYYDALSAFDRARQACSAAQDRGGVSASFYNQAFVCRQLRQNIEALQLLTQAESHLPSISFADRWRTQILSERIFNLMGLKRYDEALSHVDTWVSLADGEYTPYLVRGDIYRQRGDLQRALEDYVGAISSLSRHIVNLRTERFQRTDSVQHKPEFDRCLATALEAGESEVALILLELSYTGALGSRHYDIRESDMQVAQQETKLRDRAADLVPTAVEAAAKRDPRLLAEGQDQADWLVSEWEFLYTEEGSFPSGIQNARKAALQICRTLPEDALALEFTEAEGQFWMFAISREGVETHLTGLTVLDVGLLSLAFDYECKGRFRNDALERLSLALIAPISKRIAGKNHLLVHQGTLLQGIPFQALSWEGNPLIESFTVSYITSSLTGLGVRPKEERVYSPAMKATFIGAPVVEYEHVAELPGVRDEVERVQGLFSSPSIHLDPPATSSQLMDSAGIPGVLHVSCHGVYEKGSPLLSRLLLADRPVFSFEIILAGFKARLVVLTACQTAEGMMEQGGYIQSIASAFLKSGVDAVVAAFWPVDDSAGSAFAQLFYQELLRGQGSPTSALNAAQREMRRQPAFAHPYFWAPFAVFSGSGEES